MGLTRSKILLNLQAIRSREASAAEFLNHETVLQEFHVTAVLMMRRKLIAKIIEKKKTCSRDKPKDNDEKNR